MRASEELQFWFVPSKQWFIRISECRENHTYTIDNDTDYLLTLDINLWSNDAQRILKA